MLEPTFDESIADTPATEKTVQRKTWKPSVKQFDFFWKRNSRESISKEENCQQKNDVMEVKIIECKIKNASTSRMPFNFLRNIKKHINFKAPVKYKSKQTEKEMETANLSDDKHHSTQLAQDEHSPTSAFSGSTVELKTDIGDPSKVNLYSVTEAPDICGTSLRNVNASHSVDKNLYETDRQRNYGQTVETATSRGTDIAPLTNSEHQRTESQQSQIERLTDTNLSCQTDTYKENVRLLPEITDAVTNDSKVKASLTEELLKLSKYGWYWGPISGDEADAKLISEPDGAFLVRDSSDDRYVLTLSFKSSGKLLHARMEHSGGLFSLCNQSESEGFTSVAALINHSMNYSQSAVFCYSRPKYPGYPSFPVRLTKPVSRFTQVRSLQYLCRFVIRQNTRLDNIHKLPLPKTIKGYIEEAHY